MESSCFVLTIQVGFPTHTVVCITHTAFHLLYRYHTLGFISYRRSEGQYQHFKYLQREALNKVIHAHTLSPAQPPLLGIHWISMVGLAGA